jgi:adenosylhomocysteine nucleosidase
MGVGNAAEATAALIAAHRPELLVSFGFGGAVRRGTAAGDLVLATRLFRLESGKLTRLQGPDCEFTERARKALEIHSPSAFQVHLGAFITTDRIENKQGLAGLLDPDLDNPLLEMETGAVAWVASGAGIPLVAIRAVSDTADEELDFSIGDITDKKLNVSIPRVLLTLARKPRILPQLLRLSRNSRLAGNHLASGILAVLQAF